MEKFLLNWKSKDNRYPLIIRGARQIGKTYSISYFGKSNYKYLLNITFDTNPADKDIFSEGSDVNKI